MMRNAFCITAIRYGTVFKGGESDGQDRHCCRKRYGADLDCVDPDAGIHARLKLREVEENLYKID